MTSNQILTSFSKGKHLPVDAIMIMLHGLGADGHDFVDLVPEFTQDFNIKVLLPHAPAQALTIADGEKVPSWYDILATGDSRIINQEQLRESVDRVLAIVTTDSEYEKAPLIIAGFSQGGAVALECLMTLPLTFKGCLAMSTYLINTPGLAAEHLNEKTPILMQHGKQDPVVHYSLGERSAETLRKQGFTVKWESYPMQHQVCLPQLKAIQSWINTLLSA